MDKPSKIHCACGVRFAVAIGYSIATGMWTPICVPHMQEFSGPTAPLREWCEPMTHVDEVFDVESEGGID